MSNENLNRQLLYLAALLHDIGKFVFRAQELKAGEGHEVLGERFIREHLGKVRASATDVEAIVEYSKHHQTAGYCSIADRITSAERIPEDSRELRRPLVSIFQNIFREINNRNHSPLYYKPDGIYYHEPEPIKIEKIISQKDSCTSESEKWIFDETKSIKLHKDLYDRFRTEFKSLNNIKHYETLCQSLYYLLHKYTAKISSASYKSYPDISLFDHSRTTAALVNCLTYLLKEEDLKNYNPEKTDKQFMLIKGDLSGIQKFIYSDISPDKPGDTKGLAKRLRGRSFYVALLTDFIASLFIKNLELADANILYSGGGHFLLVTSCDEMTEQKTNDLVKQINLMLRDKLSSRLTLIIGTSSFDKTLFSNAAEAIQKVNYELNKGKNRKYSSYLNEIIFYDGWPNEFNDDEKLGENLPYGRYLIEITSEEPQNLLQDRNLVASFKEFNTFYFIIGEPYKGTEKDAIRNLFAAYKSEINSARLFKLNDTDFLEFADDFSREYDFPISYGFKFVGTAAPKDHEGNVLSFEQLSELDSENGKKLSYPLLGILRLDVDNLGLIFGLGLEEHGKRQREKNNVNKEESEKEKSGISFSRIATLSRELHHFFCGYVNHLAEKHQIYTAYSGGDDAFFIGSWINILHFAKEFHKSFKEFTCNNPNITFSAGIFFCDVHYPVVKFAEDAKQMEKKSKQFEHKSKNAITVFDHTLRWDDFISMLDFSVKLLKHTKTKDVKDSEKLARSMVHRILRIIKSSLHTKGKYQGEVDVEKLYSNITQLHYLFARHGFTNSEIETAEDELKRDIIKVILQNFNKKELVKNYLIPTSYVVLKTRNTEKSIS